MKQELDYILNYKTKANLSSINWGMIISHIGKSYTLINTRFFRTFLMLLLMVVSSVGAWAQITPTTDTNSNGIYEDNEKNLYLIQTNQFQSFYITPNGDNLNTVNLPHASMLWYFLEAENDNGTQYYYIVNNSTGKYICNTDYATPYRTIKLANFDAGSPDKFKFKLVENNATGSTGYYNIDIKPNGSGWLGLNKQGGNALATNGIRLTNKDYIDNINSRWKFIPYNGTFVWPDPPFTLSTNESKTYYRIRNKKNTAFYISTDQSTSKVIYSNAESNDMAWYFKEASSDGLMKYYYIINPAAVDKYMYYNGTATNGSDQSNAVSIKAIDEEGAETDRFLFVIVQAAVVNGDNPVDGYYMIVPKLLIEKLWNSNSIGTKTTSNGSNMGIITGRSTDGYSHWSFVTTEYPMHCVTPTITFDNTTGKVTITTSPADASIYYTTDGETTPTSSSTAYSSPFTITEQTTIKAIASKAGYEDSEVATKTIYKVATPTIQDNGNNTVSIVCATAGVTIYYTTDGSTPTTSSTMYEGPLTDDVSGKTIKAIAVKSGMINSAVGSGSVTMQCAKPVFTKSGDNLTITCSFPTSGVTIKYIKNGGDADPNITYSSPITVTTGDVVKAIAIADGYTNSEIATKRIFNELTPDGTGKYLITSQDEFENFIDMASTEEGADKHYVLQTDVTAGSEIPEAFTGIFDGGGHTISSPGHALFNSVNGGTVKNVILSGVSISGGANAGAIANEATGDSRIYNVGVLSGSVGGSGNVGGIVGQLDGSSRVINCFSYANITGGSDVGGIVGYNNVASTAANIQTMVMNCMFYGDITGGSNKSPVYGGQNINNLQEGLNTYNYYAYSKLPTSHITEGKYNCALAVEDKYLNRFEFYRQLLNSNRRLAAKYASTTSTTVNATDMMKWVLETADRKIAAPMPYPILKAQDTYPSIINYDTRDLDNYTEENRNKGLKTGVLTVNINIGSGAPTGASITNGSLTLTRTDKDFDRFNFNYDKVQLPYYNEVGTGNCTYNKVVTGWKITAIDAVTNDPYTSSNYPSSGVKDFPDHNYADRKSSNKDLYSVSGRVFSQGAYFDVPYGVRSITIEPYWGNAAYVADEYLDVVYSTGYVAQSVTQLGETFSSGKITIDGSEQVVHKTITDALKTLGSATVYDNAVVLVGNLHQGTVPANSTQPFTIMSADLDHDNEPDYSMIYHHNNRQSVSPIRFDFINIPGTAQAQKPNGATTLLNFTIFLMRGWFEVTNTCIVYSNQVEYENKDKLTGGSKANAPLILLGGEFEQFVSTRATTVDGKTTYIHVGGNIKIDNFGVGTHGDGNKGTPHIPVSVTGGEFKGFYLTGTYNPNAEEMADNAECYISGGHFVEAAGACQEPINGNVHWQIYNADIDAFYGGGINDARPIKGTITTDIYNSHVTLFCGGPKFGNMTAGKAVTTNAEGCVFDQYFGAGYGGLSYSRQKYIDASGFKFDKNPYTTDKEKYFDGNTTYADGSHKDYGKKGPGVATDFDYEFFVWSTGVTGARMYVKFASFSLAQCDNVISNLKGCTVNKNFYGGGSLGKVTGTATSVLENCTVNGNVFGGGYSGTIPSFEVRNAGFTKNPEFNSASGIFEAGEFSGTTTYTWKNAAEAGVTLSDGGNGSDPTNHYIYTNQDLTTLGQVGHTVLTIKGTTKVSGFVEGETPGGVFGGGDMSAVNGSTQVNIEATDATDGVVNVFGGGNTADVVGTATVTMTGGKVSTDIYGGGKGQTTVVTGDVTVGISAGTVSQNVYGGSKLGTVNVAAVTLSGGTVSGSVFGGGLGQTSPSSIAAQNLGNTTVTISGGTVSTAVYGGSNANGVLKGDATVTITGGTVGTVATPVRDAVFGGGFGEPTLVEGNVTVNIGTKSNDETPVYTGTATINGNIYGGGALGNVNTSKPASDLVFDATKKVDVNLYKGTINGDVFGGGLGQKNGVNGAESDILSYVGGNVNVTLDGAKVPGSIFGCNNLNGTPKGHVKVHVLKTVDSTKDENTARESRITNEKPVDVAAVYGGGNKADYIPTNATIVLPEESAEDYNTKLAQLNAARTEVIIEGCNKTSIGYVYGGGNAAAVPATEVTIKGSYIIDYVFGGGNGSGEGNPGANVGVYKLNSVDKNYGTGKAVTKLLGGYINNVYGGSNTKGDIRGGTDVRTKKKDETVSGDCCPELKTGKIYGAGSHADVNGDVNITLECMPEDYIAAVYGGAEKATVKGDVVLTVTSGKFGRVFGGNNEGGDIQGSITVNVYEDGCKPLIIGELYGGGNAAPYSIYGCTGSGSTWTANTSGTLYFDEATKERAAIQVNIYSCTSVGKVYGGGRGETAQVIGNTHVWINPMKGVINGTPQDNIGKVGQVFGGGALANVKGNTLVDIGTSLVVDAFAGGNGALIESGTDYLDPESNTNISITSGVYGGGSEADVDGDATLNIGTKDLPLNTVITGNIYGGGLGEGTHVTGDVTVNIGKRTGNSTDGYAYEGYANITGDVYGGSAKGKVNSGLVSSTETYTEGKATQVNLYGGTISGNLYGGGLGEATHAADVYGGVTVNVKGGSANNVFGCNNVNGTPKSTVVVNIDGGRIYKSVYGGGNQAIMDGSPVVYVTAGTIGTDNEGNTVYGGAVYGNVYGGGLGSDGTGNQTDLEKVKAGLVKGNTEVNISGGTILHNIYGGGAYGSVGTFTYDNTTRPTGLETTNTGKATINITGGIIGSNGHENGMVFGSSRGDVGAPDDIHDKLAWVYDTEVNIGTSGEGHGTDAPEPQIKGSVYGGGENGHTFNNASVTIHSGRIGITDTNIDGGAAYEFRGNVYGSGCGTDKYDNDTKYNPKAGIVGGNANVTISGGHVVRNVYGGGAMGSVTGGTTVNISGNSVIGAEGSGGGYVYAAARGEDDMGDGLATVGSTALNISGGTIWGSAFGGGQLGSVKRNVNVTVSGGTVKNDVYGGGALANTNTDNWNTSTNTWSDTSTDAYYAEVKHLSEGASVTGYYTRSGEGTELSPYSYEEATGTATKDTKYYKKLTGFLNVAANGTTYKTTVSLTGGTIGNAYGGGLGRFAVAAVGSPGDPGYVAAVEAVEAMVYGDVTVTVDGTKFTKETERVDGKAIPTTGRVFGCNNKNGTPKGSVLVWVKQTKRLDGADGHVKNQFEIQGVYGGGNMANYVPNTDSYDVQTEFGRKTQVLIQDCGTTSIERVYGGGNASNVPFTDVTIDGCFQIGYVFGGGNGGDKINKETGAGWENNPGANVTDFTNVLLKGGTIGDAFGGSDSNGSVGGTNLVKSSGSCPLVINNVYGASKEADSDGDVILDLSGCGSGEVDKVFGGSYNANVRGSVTINITSGIYTSVFGGNDRKGSIGGNVTINIEEVDECNPIIIQNLFGGGSQADYPGTGAKYVTNAKDPSTNRYTGDGVTYNETTGTYTGLTYADFTSGTITLNIKAATRIDRVFGGCDNAKATGNTVVNINMVKGSKAGGRFTLPTTYTGETIPTVHAEEAYVEVTDLTENKSPVTGYYERSGELGSYVYTLTEDTKAQNGKTYYERFTHVVDDAIGTIGNVYGGGNDGDVDGNTTVNIGTEKDVIFVKTPAHLQQNSNEKYDVLGANITGNVFGGGNEGNVTGNTHVNISTADFSTPLPTGFQGVSIAESVYGGGNGADVQGNTSVTMAGGFVMDGVYGGGLHGSVGSADPDATDAIIYHTGSDEHPGCIGKIEKYKEGTGKCTVVISGGQVGPVEAAMTNGGMKNTGNLLPDAGIHHHPVDVGFVFGAGRGEVENPDTDPDADFRTYVKETDVTISGGIVMASVYGGGENGRVRGNTHVKIQGGQIGCGEGKITGSGTAVDPYKPKIHSDQEWSDANPTNFSDCASWDYGKKVGEKTVYLPYDPLADKPYRDGSPVTNGSTEGSDGHTYYGYVFGGGSGYFPYEIKNSADEVIAHDWLPSAGLVEGNTKVEISGGHILTCVYGGNELTSVTGDSCVVIMTGGTLGVPRSNENILKKPVTCYLFGGGKGDQREHFKMYTNVKNTRVEVKGTARIFGSVFGGAEDGHVSGNVKVNILGTAKIGMNGTSYVDGNVFGGGRGFSGTELTAGTVKGNTEINISGTPEMYGSIYGGGRLASVGVDFAGAQNATTGQFVEDETGDNPKTYGHVTINISGGTIGKEGVTGDGAKYSGNVFGGSMGRLTLLDGSPNSLWNRMAQVKTSTINITGGTIKRNVYGGAEFGTTRDHVYVTVGGTRAANGDITPSGSPVINGSVFGGGKGSTEHRPEYNSTITAGEAPNQITYLFTPLQYAGCIGGNTYVDIVGDGQVKGQVKGNVYGGGELASVGVIDYRIDTNNQYTQVIKHDKTDTDKNTFYDFGLSWPYEFKYVPGINGGKTYVNITGGQVGTGDNATDNGYVFGGGKGQVSFGDKIDANNQHYDDITEQRYTEAHLANVRETEVTISGGTIRTVYGGGEDGHVNENAKVTINSGTIGRTVFGGGKGTSTFKTILLDATSGDNQGKPKSTPEDINSWTAGKVYGNTEVIMNGGSVGWFVYGGGNMASVGKGNYTGGSDDYSKGGYGELPSADGEIWTATPEEGSYADHFQNSGKTTVTILGGNVGPTTSGNYAAENGIPLGSIFGGSRGKTAKNITESPRYKYGPDFFLGYVNKATINIGGTTESGATNGDGPNIYGSIYGGGQDGHVRNSTEVKIFKGDIKGQTGDDLGRSGHVFGAGSGIGTYTDGGSYCNNSSGSVTCTTLVEVSGTEATTKISGNVYGGGALASVGPPKIGQPKNEQKEVLTTSDHKSYSCNTVNIKGGSIGGSVFGAGRGPGAGFLTTAFTNGVSTTETSPSYYNPTIFATSLWTEVNIEGGTITNNVYGGGEMGQTKESTVVNLKGGKVTHDAYGGGMGTTGTNAIEANVEGNTTVELNNNNNGADADGSKRGCVVNRIFGCNDMNGTPKGHVTVHVYATQNSGTAKMSTKVAPPEYNSTKGSSETYAEYLKRLIDVAKPNGTVLTGVDGDVISTAEVVYNTYQNKADASLTTEEKKTITDAAKTVINQLESLHDYDVEAVYGGGDLAPYEPTSTTENTEVIIEGCGTTSIKQVYGGGNAASVPATDVLVKSCAIIDELFGGGNGKDSYQYTDNKWYENPGANVGYRNYMQHVTNNAEKDGSTEALAYPAEVKSDATSPEAREAYKYGKGTAHSIVNGGHIHTVYGGSNTKGNISNGIELQLLQAGTCTLVTDEAYASSKSAETDAPTNLILDCVKEGGTIYGGSYNAYLNSDVNILITNGHYEKVFGGNNQAGTINGKITITVQEAGCTPITIDELYGGGYLAPYSIYGYKKNAQEYVTEHVVTEEKDGSGNYIEVDRCIPLKAGDQGALATPYWNPRINIVSATRIGKIFGGGYGAGATMIGSPHINVNMEKGMILEKYAKENAGYSSLPADQKDAAGNQILSIGTIGDIYGGGEKADVIGNTYVEIGTGQWISEWDVNGNPVWETTNTSGEKLLYKLETPAVTYTQDECDTYNAKLTGAIATSDVAYTFTSYADNSGSTQHGTGKVKQVSQEGGWTTVLVTSNTPVDSNAPSFVGQQFKVNATALTANTYYQLYSTANEELPIYVTVETSSYTDTEVNTYNATLTGARNTNDIKTPAVWAWYDEHDESAAAPTTTGRNAATITGNVFGGGKGETKDSGNGAFKCESAMVGADGDGLIDANGGTSVTIANGTVGTLEGGKLKAGTGNVYGGGELGRVEKNTVVTIGLEGNTTNEVAVHGNVFGAGKGVATHGYAALVRGNSTVTIQGKSKVGGSVYGGGEIASVGRYNVNATTGLPESLKNEKSGNCTVIVRDDAEIGPDDMTMTKEGGPDNSGHVFGAGKGATPYINKDGNAWAEPWRVKPDNSKDIFNTTTYTTADNAEAKYLSYIESLGLATQTDVTISGNAFVKGDVFGGAEQGFVQHDTHVTIEGNCQIGNGYVQMNDDGTYLGSPLSVNRRYTDAEWTAGKLIMGDNDRTELKNLVSTTNYQTSLPECASWKYGQAAGTGKYAAHDIYANSYDSKGGSTTGDNGSTFYGNVFGGGSGYFPYAAGKWHWKAGDVGGNTLVEIKGGHILTNVYGGNELTNVAGKSTVNMSGGTIGVPRTLGQIAAHPVTCYLFGGGKGDPRVLFNKQTNVNDVEVNISGGWIYGSAFGGGEDGHVMRNVTMNIDGTAKIGTWGTSYVDGNIFGGGRGFAGDAYTAGNVAGSVTLNIKNGEILGSVYGGGRLGSVGYGLYEATETGKYGTMRPDGYEDDGTTEVAGFKRGYVTINISGGTIGNTNEFIIPDATNIAAAGIENVTAIKDMTAANWITWKKYHNVPNTVYDTTNGRVTHTKGGNVYAGGMGRYTQLDGSTPISTYDGSGTLTSPIEWKKLGNVKSTTLNISGTPWIMGNVYGGGEMGAVTPYTDSPTNPTKVEGGTTSITISGGTIGTEVTGTTPVKTTVQVPENTNSSVLYTFGSVYGGGMGMENHDNTGKHGGDVNGNTTVSMSGSSTAVRASVYGGGEIAIVHGNTDVTISGGKIGRNEVKAANDTDPGYVMFGGATMGNVYGGGKGALEHVEAGLVKGNTKVTISSGETAGEPFIYHNVYGGGALASVGNFTTSKGTGDEAYVPEGIPLHWTSGGTATVTINGGTIGISGRDNGMVNGSSRGGIEKPNPTDRYDKLAWVKDAVVTIGEASVESTGPHIKGSVYGGGENGHNSGNTTVTVNRGTIGIVNTTDQWYSFIPANLSNTDPSYATYEAIDKKALVTRGNVYGAGCGTDMYDSDNDGIVDTHNPKSGMVAGNTEVNINGGHIGHSVYGAGSMGSVGTITNGIDTLSTTKHADETNGFALSWPYKFVFAEGTGKATVNITGGHIGNNQQDGGDVFGSARGEAGDRYATSHMAFVNETEVNINYSSTPENPTETGIDSDNTIPCITGSVHGSGEDGYVYGDAKVTINNGLVGHSVYGAGKGKGTYKISLLKVGATEGSTNDDDYYTSDIYSLISGKVMGNTYVTMNGGHVMRNVYGGGNMASVGKGNYTGGADDYFPSGYGEKLTGNLWDNESEDSKAFLSSGKATVKVFGGKVGYIDADPSKSIKNNLPYGNVFGGSAGEPAPNVPANLTPRYHYCPAFFSGYVNETDVTIGGYRCKTEYGTYKVGDYITDVEYNALSSDKANWELADGPTILASVYGGGQDGHVRRDTKVTVNRGEIGLAFTEYNRQNVLKTSGSTLNEELDNDQWLHRGNVYGAGSGISEYTSTLKYDKDYTGNKVPETGYSTSAGSVTRHAEVNVFGGIIHRNVYGGGSMGSVGAPRINQDYDLYKKGDTASGHTVGKQSTCSVNISGTVGTPDGYNSTDFKYNPVYGGEVYGASRGDKTLDPTQFATTVWTVVKILNGANIMNNVFGGGDAGIVKKDSEVIVGE